MARILVIDDDEALRTVIQMVLTQLGHEVFEAQDGRHGVEIFKEFGADLVLTDIVMPEQDGLETIFELRRKLGVRKIIAMTGGGRMTPEEYLNIARQMGASQLLVKPFSNEELKRAVTDLLGQL